MKKRVYVLCKGRHEMSAEIEGAIFSNTLDPLDIDGMEKIASDKLEGVRSLTLYVTGLSVALVAVINVCHQKCIELVLMHFDRATGNYYPQKVK